MSSAIQLQQPQVPAQWKSTSAIKARVQAIQQLMADVLKPATKENGWDGDYGAIPGTGNKPSLLKSGSEQILAMFEIAVDPVVEDLSTEDCQRYRVTARLIHVPSQNFLGAGIGEASTDETKYKWKRTYSRAEFDHTDPSRRRIKYSSYKNNNGMYEEKEEMQIRTEPADLGNTVLKMAKKRAQIDATLTVTGASSMFQQDLEEEAVQDAAQERPKAARGKKTSQGTQKVEDVKCASCGAVNGHLPSCKHHPSQKSGTGQVQGQVVPKETKAEETVAKPSNEESFLVKTCNKKKSNRGADYLELIGKDDKGRDAWRYVWHGHLQKEPCDLSQAIGKLCVWDISSTKSGENTYYSVEKVHSIGTQAYEDDKTVASPSAQDVGFDAPANEDIPW